MADARFATLDQKLLREIVAKEFALLTQHRPQYSLRAFARKLKISAASLSQFLNGKRLLATSGLVAVLESLYPEQDERTRVTQLLKGVNSSSEQKFVDYGVGAFELISDWYYMALIHLAESGQFSCNPARLARRFRLPLKTVRDALAKLIALGIISAEDGQLRATGKPFIVESPLGSQAIRGFHRQHLELAIDSLETCPVAERDMSYISILTNRRDIKKVREKIRAFRENLAASLESTKGPNSDLYALCVQLFPLTQTERKPGDDV